MHEAIKLKIWSEISRLNYETYELDEGLKALIVRYHHSLLEVFQRQIFELRPSLHGRALTLDTIL